MIRLLPRIPPAWRARAAARTAARRPCGRRPVRDSCCVRGHVVDLADRRTAQQPLRAADRPGARLRPPVRAERCAGRHRSGPRLDGGRPDAALHPAAAAVARLHDGGPRPGSADRCKNCRGSAVVATWAAALVQMLLVERRFAREIPRQPRKYDFKRWFRRGAAADGHHRLRSRAAEHRRADRIGLSVADRGRHVLRRRQDHEPDHVHPLRGGERRRQPASRRSRPAATTRTSRRWCATR